jgi:hydroxypyruvate reductase
MSLQQRRNQLLHLYQTALTAVSGEAAVLRYLQHHPINETFSLVAIGKAAAAMAKGAEKALGGRLRSGLVITKHGHGDPSLDNTKFVQLESSHPIPDEQSLLAGTTLLEFLAHLPEGELLLFLLSGGASSLVEVLPDEMNTDQLEDLNRWLLASGLPIDAMNAVRKRLSRIKGGKLLPYLNGRRCLQLLISDVPGDDLSVIGSAPLIPETHPQPIPPSLPLWLSALMALQRQTEVTEVTNIESHIIARNDLAREAVNDAAQQMGVDTINHQGHFQGEARELAAQFSEVLLNGPAGISIWGGESSVVLPEQPGRGGRNQHLALAAARHLAGHENVLLLSAGTDGSDGRTEESGALVDGGTLQRGEWEGMSISDALQAADAGRFLEASGDLIQTGPTGTNVMDLVIGWKW